MNIKALLTRAVEMFSIISCLGEGQKNLQLRYCSAALIEVENMLRYNVDIAANQERLCGLISAIALYNYTLHGGVNPSHTSLRIADITLKEDSRLAEKLSIARIIKQENLAQCRDLIKDTGFAFISV